LEMPRKELGIFSSRFRFFASDKGRVGGEWGIRTAPTSCTSKESKKFPNHFDPLITHICTTLAHLRELETIIVRTLNCTQCM
jgi:hypothetical protein